MAQLGSLQLGRLQPVWRALRLGGRAALAGRSHLHQQPQQLAPRLSTAAHAAQHVVAAAAEAAPAAAQQGSSLELQLHNTLSRQKEVFRPRPGQDNRVSMYVCGVTVYDYSHIGHARVYVAFDVIYRFLRHLGYDVNYVRNFTDVDDKIIARAAAVGEDPLALAQRFIHEFHADMEALGCLRPGLEPKATDFIPQMVATIQRIIDNGHGYAVGGDVFFDVASLPGYGKLSGRSQEDNRAGERVAVDERKRGAADFALWKAAKPGEPTWDSPWGPGRPGWHIECSTMIREVMGEQIDIHGGGRDLVFPHHENELAQSRAAAGPCSCGHDHGSGGNGSGGSGERDDFVRYWLHNGFVNVDSEKMSKSLGNFFTIRDVVARYHPRALRWFLVNTQYRQPINYTQRALEEASDRVYYLYQTMADISETLSSSPEGAAALEDAQRQVAAATAPQQAQQAAEAAQQQQQPAAGKAGKKAAAAAASSPGAELLAEVRAALADDFNTPLAIAALSAPLKAANDFLHTKKGKKAPGRLQALASYQAGLQAVLELLGLWAEQPAAVLAELRALALTRAGLSEEQIAAAIEERAAARAAKDYAASDAVRLRLEAAGILIMDTPEGTTWKPGPRLHIAEEENAATAAPVAVADEEELQPGSLVKSYGVVKRLGAGQFAVVYKVQAPDGHMYALKQERFGEMSHADRVEALNELRLLASLRHPNLVQYNEAFVEEDRLYMVMELVDGGTLVNVIRSHAAQKQRIPEAAVWTYLLQIARGLQHLHSHSIVHRDIKPANLLLTPAGLLKVADLGVAGQLRPGVCEHLQVGTAGFMSPEVARKQCQDVRSDVYSLGVTLFELCMLRSPFGNKNEPEVLHALLAWSPGDAAMAAAAIIPQYSQELQGLLKSMLQPNPEARPTADQILARHGTPERLARLPVPPPQDVCGRPWAASQRSPILPPIPPHADLDQLEEHLPPPCCDRIAAQSVAKAT
ncbi:cysteine--tRNA cytoplasmic isoform X1 [Chlorella sorokiniana]|uniref:cysteine--tRNA ligase n=1 Tax=Chlorella sorokiniana TaxID=3076 RepID=A0A2P6U0R8_CHLSO|nr:cysteine--tRNA cytoplasmic isoform X1 [Chlorella sorokiniana]|eukprot:PRW59911.1 cysteine--tRNA cytoplasmic isoform X1 [Chlorella sorokiniana]